MLTISERLTPDELVKLIEKDYRKGINTRGEKSKRAYQEAWDNCRRGLDMYPNREILLKEREKLVYWFDLFHIPVNR